MPQGFGTELVLRDGSPRGDDMSRDGFYGNGTQGMQDTILNLMFSQDKDLRTSIIILGAFNIAAALLTVSSILLDAWKSSRRNVSFKPRRKRNFLTALHPAEVFPLILSSSIVIQGLIFTGAQATGLRSVRVTGCSKTAQIVWPTLWLIPFVTLIFGLETAVRSFKKPRFRRRGKWNVPICLLAVALMLLVVWLPSKIEPSQDRCLADLMSWTSHYALLGAAMLGVISMLLIAVAVVIFIQLVKNVKVDPNERIAATRVVSYIILVVILMSFVLPYFIQQTLHRIALETSHIAAVVLNLSGFANGLLHLFLRSNANATAIRPTETPWQTKGRFKMFGGNDLDLCSHITSPITLARSGSHLLHQDEKSTEAFSPTSQTRFPPPIYQPQPWSQPPSRNPSSSQHKHPTTRPKTPRLPPLPTLSTITLPPTPNLQPYTLFPTTTTPTTTTTKTHLPKLLISNPKRETTHTYISPTPSSSCSHESLVLLSPPKAAALFSPRHKRESSEYTSATVQIGLRVSGLTNAPVVASRSPVIEDFVSKDGREFKMGEVDCKRSDDNTGSAISTGGSSGSGGSHAGNASSAGGTDINTEKTPKNPKMKNLPPVPRFENPEVGRGESQWSLGEKREDMKNEARNDGMWI
ncbi:MAG: hypothetical protein M1812_007077 [Candelaria pacifica]|nr:MAG: hypothetical protein M1812_007077 [Candelaria pacifica]